MRAVSSSRPILITGATGFVGQHLLTALKSRGVPSGQCVAIGKDSGDAVDVKAYYQGDISDRNFVYGVFEAVRPGTVIHLAAIAEPAKAFKDQDLAWRVNVDGTRHIAAAMMERAGDARLIFSGSAESYGESFNLHSGPIKEDAALMPRNFYGATKAISDVMLGQLQMDGLDIVRVRAFNHTGPGQSPAYVVPAFVQQIARIEAGLQEPVIKVGNLDAERDFLDVRDVVNAYAAIALHEGAIRPQAYNVSSGTPRRIGDILSSLLALSDKDIDIEQDPGRLRPSEVATACGDPSAISSVFAWTPEISFDQTLQDTLDGFRAQTC